MSSQSESRLRHGLMIHPMSLVDSWIRIRWKPTADACASIACCPVPGTVPGSDNIQPTKTAFQCEA